MKSLLTLRKETEQNDPSHNYAFSKPGLTIVVEDIDAAPTGGPYVVYRYTHGKSGWCYESKGVEGWNEGSRGKGLSSRMVFDLLHKGLSDDCPDTHKLVHRSDTMSRYGVAYPLDTYRRPDGSYYARWDLTKSLTVRYGLPPGEDGDKNGYGFVDPNGGPFIAVGHRRTFFESDPDGPGDTLGGGSVTHIHVDPDHQNISLLEIEPINQ